MRNFSKVNPQIWGRKPFKDLSASGKLMMLYFLTSRHQTSAGCYQIPDGYVMADLGWSVDEYKANRDEVEKSGMIAFDLETQEVYIIGWFKENPITNPNHREGARRIIYSLESETLCNFALEEMGD